MDLSPEWRDRLSATLGAVVRTYAQILFSSSPWVGLLLLLGTFVVPRVGAFGLLAVITSLGVARFFRLSEEQRRTGLFSYNSMLVGLGGGVLFESSVDGYVLLAVGIITATFLTAALWSALGTYFALPPLTLPFLFVFYMMLGAARVLDVPLLPLLAEAPLIPIPLPDAVDLYLRSLGALFFLPRGAVRLVLLLALVLSRRVSPLLSVFGFGLAFLVQGRLVLVGDGTMPLVLGYNFILTAIALGGVWFVPGGWSLTVALGGALVCGMVAVGMVPMMTVQGLPVLILPFNLTIILLLYAMRQRTEDGRPKSVDFELGSPEQNLHRYQSRVGRFGAHYALRFHAPFLGKWTCTQGVRGAHTHRGEWQHAFDFEVFGPDGEPFRGKGDRPEDYLCFRLPVLAVADGTVVRVVDGVPDSPIDKPDLRANWGNLVLIMHAPGIYSLVCHLARGSVKVKEGQVVRQGVQIAACGSSGRSPVPHLHFQLQSSPRIGAPTIHTELHDVLALDGPEPALQGTMIPTEGQALRNLQPSAEADLYYGFRVGVPLEFVLAGPGIEGRHETIEASVSLLGDLVVESRQHGASLRYEYGPSLFTVLDVSGDARSMLHQLRAALPRAPLEIDEKLAWEDRLERRDFLPLGLRALYDVVSPFLRDTGVVMHYRLEREPGLLVVVGESARRGADGQAWIRTRAELREQRGLCALEVSVRGRTRSARRRGDAPDDEARPAAGVEEAAA